MIYEVDQRVLARAANRQDWHPATIEKVPENRSDPKANYWVKFDDYLGATVRSAQEIKPLEGGSS